MPKNTHSQTTRLYDEKAEQRRIERLNRPLTEVIARMNLGQLKCCLYLKKHGFCPIGELAEVATISTAGLTGLRDTLVELDLIKSEPSRSDRRKVLLQLTERGQALVKLYVEEMKYFSEEQEDEKEEN